MTVNITTTGDDNTFDIFVGETNDAQNLVAAFTPATPAPTRTLMQKLIMITVIAGLLLAERPMK